MKKNKEDLIIKSDTITKNIKSKNYVNSKEVNELIKSSKKGNKKTINELFLLHMKLVDIIARKNVDKGLLEYSDLKQLGYIGLLKACNSKNYDFSKNISFSKYAYSSIENSICDGKRIATSLHVCSKSEYYDALRLSRAENMLTQRLKREPTREDLSQECNMTVDKVDRLRLILLNSSNSSLEELTNKDEYGISIENSEENEKNLEKIKTILRKCSKVLNKKQKYVLKYRYCNGVKKTYKEIGMKLKISPQGVKQIEQHAIEILRKEIENDKSFRQITKN